MKVLYDHQIFSSQKIGGISRYFYELINTSAATFVPCIAAKYHKNIYLSQILESLPYSRTCDSYFGGRSFPGKGVICGIKDTFIPRLKPKAINQAHVIRQLSEFRPDIFHPTYYSDYFLEHLQGVPFVLTIYDMVHEIFPEYFQNDTTRFLKKKLFASATHVIAISESTKKDVMEIYEDSGEKISVVHLANSLNAIKGEHSLDNELPEKYLLFVGKRSNYKNFLFFISSITGLLKNDPSLAVVCTDNPFTMAELKYFEHLGISSKIHHYFANDNELVSLYNNALAFIFPSLYEGFGIPVLEAFACGCPVLLSNSSSLPEVGGDAAVYFDPKSVHETRHSTENVLYDQDLRKEMVRKGYERLKLFSWEKAVEETSAIYRKCL